MALSKQDDRNLEAGGVFLMRLILFEIYKKNEND